MSCHLGPVYAITRNPSFLKNFLTVGDWTARIWSEDCRESAIIWTKHQVAMLTDGIWSPTKCSMFFISRMDGVLDAWDLLQQQNEPVLSIKVCDEPLLCMRAHEGGRLLAGGSELGATFLIEVSDNMATSMKNDKPLLTAMFERENKREKILEAKLRELKLKVKTAQLAHADTDESRAARATALQGNLLRPYKSMHNLLHIPFSLASCLAAEQEFIKGVEKEKAKMFPKLYKTKRRQKIKRLDENGEEIESENENEDFEDEDGSLVSD